MHVWPCGDPIPSVHFAGKHTTKMAYDYWKQWGGRWIKKSKKTTKSTYTHTKINSDQLLPEELLHINSLLGGSATPDRFGFVQYRMHHT